MIELQESLIEGFGPACLNRQDVLMTAMRKEAKREYDKRYHQTKRYAEYENKRRQTQEYKEYQKSYHQTSKYKEYEKKRAHDPNRLGRDKIRKATLEYKTERKQYARDFRKTDDYQNWRKEYESRPERKIKVMAFKRSEKSKLYQRIYRHNRYRKDAHFRIDLLLRWRLISAMRHYSKTGKIMSSKKYGIDYAACIKHLGTQPDTIHKWHIDHIIPCCSFDLSNPEEVKKCFAPENLRWLPAKENFQKGAQDKLLKRGENP